MCVVYAGGGRRESRFDTNPRYMAARNAERSIGKIEDCKQPISKQRTKRRKYNSTTSEYSIVIGKKKTIELFNNQSGATNLYWPL